jgi:hypothetical protein
MPAGLNGDHWLSALVVLAAPAAPGAGGYTAADGPPALPESAERLRDWFSAKGFEADPIVGISFSISGPRDLFADTFAGSDPGPDGELDLTALRRPLEPSLAASLAAVVVNGPPDFGPGNP